MEHIRVRLLQTPLIELDGHQVTFFLKKADALFFYMCVEKNTTRTKLSTLLWGGQPEETARKNLRNALYAIKKSLGFDPFESPKKQILKLNSSVSFDIDTDTFLASQDIDLYGNEFLHGFSLKDSYEYDEWMNAERSRFTDLYLQRLYQRFLDAPAEDFETRENIFHRYIQADPLDERIYQKMLECCLNSGQYRKGLRYYEELVKQLRQELNLSPAPELTRLYQAIVQNWKESLHQPTKDRRKVFQIYGREREMTALRQSWQSLMTGQGGTLFVSGERGVGKTFLCQEFLRETETEDMRILTASCISRERSFPLNTWNHIILQLLRDFSEGKQKISPRHLNTINNVFPLFQSLQNPEQIPQDVAGSYNYRAARNSVIHLLSKLSEEKPLILFIDDIQNMDSLSAAWLAALIRQNIPRLLILCTCPLHPDREWQQYINQLVCLKNVRKMNLSRFTQEEVRELILARKPDVRITQAQIDRVYAESQGNPFFLDLILRRSDAPEELFSSRTQVILQEQLASLNREERLLLDLISLFQGGISLSPLEAVTGQSVFALLDNLNSLKDQELIQEAPSEEDPSVIIFSFRHQIIKEYVQEQLPASKARVYHSRIADYLEHQDGPRDLRYYSRLIYHYESAGLPARSLYNRILRLELSSRLVFDLYPVISSPLAEEKDPAASESESRPPRGNTSAFGNLLSEIRNLEKELSLCYQKYPGQIPYEDAQARLGLSFGKICVMQGSYEEGVPRLKQELSDNPYVIRNPSIARDFWRQLVYYGIQTWQLSEMKQALDHCLSIDSQLPNLSERAIDHRLTGLYYSMSGDYPEAQCFLLQAIDEFHRSPLTMQSYIIGLAACYNYLGETERRQKHYTKAAEHFQKAIQICRERNSQLNPTFFVNLARVLLLCSQSGEAESALSQAETMYDLSTVCMGRSLCSLLAALLHMRSGDSDAAAADDMRKAREAALQLGSPEELRAYYRAVLGCAEYRLAVFSSLPEQDCGWLKRQIAELSEKLPADCTDEIPELFLCIFG